MRQKELLIKLLMVILLSQLDLSTKEMMKAKLKYLQHQSMQTNQIKKKMKNTTLKTVMIGDYHMYLMIQIRMKDFKN